MKVNQNCLNLTDTRLAGPRAGAERDLDGGRPEQPAASRRQLQRLPPRRRNLRRVVLAERRPDLGGHDDPERVHPRRLRRRGPRVLAGRRGHVGGVGHQGQRLPVLPGCSTAASATSPNPDQSSGFFVYRSTGSNGASFNFPGRPVATHNDTAGAGNFLLDKQLMTVDNHKGSRSSPTGSMSAGRRSPPTAPATSTRPTPRTTASRSPPRCWSARDSALCGNTFGLPTPQGRCNENQDSQPFTAPDGTLYVVYNNFNNVVTGNDNRNQVLLARSTNGGSVVLHAGEGRRLLRAARLRHLPGRRRRPVPRLRAGEGRQPQLGVPGLELPDRRGRPDRPQPGRGHLRLLHQPQLQRDPRLHPDRVRRRRHQHLHRRQGRRLQQRHPLQRLHQPRRHVLRHDDRPPAAAGGDRRRRSRPAPTSSGRAPRSRRAARWSRQLLRPVLRHRQHHRLLRHHRVRVPRPGRPSRTSGPPRPRCRRRPSSPAQFYGDYAGIDVTATTAYPIWSDTRTVDEFLCPGTGTPANPPTVCTGSAPNAPFANDQDIFTAGVPIP